MKKTLISALALTASLSLVACSSSTDTASVATAPEQGTAAATGAVNDANNNPGGVNTALGGTTASGRSGVTNYGGLAGGIPPGTEPNATVVTLEGSTTTTVPATTTTTANLTLDTNSSTTSSSSTSSSLNNSSSSTSTTVASVDVDDDDDDDVEVTTTRRMVTKD